jgi:hypothetical protein
MGALFVGLITCGVTVAYIYVTKVNVAFQYAPLIGGIVGFLIGLFQFSILAGVIDSGVATTFVCLAEDPAALARTKPELYRQIQQVYPQIMLGF